MLNTPWIEQQCAGALREALGLTSNRGGVDGAPVHVRTVSAVGVSRRHGSPPVDPHNLSGSVGSTLLFLETEVDVLFRPMLDAGLEVVAAGPPSAERRFSHVFRGELGRFPDLPAEAGSALVAAHVGEPGVRLYDRGLLLRLRQIRNPSDTGMAPIAAAVRHLVAAHRAISAVAATLPPRPELEEAHGVLGALDLPAGVRRVGCPVGLAGAVRGVPVWLRVALAPDGLRVEAGIDLPTRGGISVSPERDRGWVRALWDLARNAPEVDLGDEAFDDRFRVVGDAGVVRELLDADARAALLALDDRIPVVLTPHGLAAAGRVPNAAALRDTAHALLAAALFLTD